MSAHIITRDTVDVNVVSVAAQVSRGSAVIAERLRLSKANSPHPSPLYSVTRIFPPKIYTPPPLSRVMQFMKDPLLTLIHTLFLTF